MQPYFSAPVSLSVEDMKRLRIQGHLRRQVYVSMAVFGFLSLLVFAAAGFWIGLGAGFLLLAYPVYSLRKIKQLAPHLGLVAIHPGEALLKEVRSKRSEYRINLHYRFEENDYTVKTRISEYVHRSVLAGTHTLEGVVDRRKPGKLRVWGIGDGGPMPGPLPAVSAPKPRNLPQQAGPAQAPKSTVGPLGIALGVVLGMALVCIVWLGSSGGVRKSAHWTEWELFGSSNISRKVEITSATRNPEVAQARAPLLSKLRWRVGTEGGNYYQFEFQNQDVTSVAFEVWERGNLCGSLTIAPGQTGRVSKQFAQPTAAFSVELGNFRYLDSTGAESGKRAQGD